MYYVSLNPALRDLDHAVADGSGAARSATRRSRSTCAISCPRPSAAPSSTRDPAGLGGEGVGQADDAGACPARPSASAWPRWSLGVQRGGHADRDAARSPGQIERLGSIPEPLTSGRRRCTSCRPSGALTGRAPRPGAPSSSSRTPTCHPRTCRFGTQAWSRCRCRRRSSSEHLARMIRRRAGAHNHRDQFPWSVARRHRAVLRQRPGGPGRRGPGSSGQRRAGDAARLAAGRNRGSCGCSGW